jgi:glutathione reductase (NADPH)
LELDELPPKIAFVGGGYISFEFAHIVARAGAKVTILHHGRRPLTKFDPDLVDMLLKGTRELGIDVQLQTAVKGINKKNSPTANNKDNNIVVITSNTNNNKENALETNIMVQEEYLKLNL